MGISTDYIRNQETRVNENRKYEFKIDRLDLFPFIIRSQQLLLCLQSNHVARQKILSFSNRLKLQIENESNLEIALLFEST